MTSLSIFVLKGGSTDEHALCNSLKLPEGSIQDLAGIRTSYPETIRVAIANAILRPQGRVPPSAVAEFPVLRDRQGRRSPRGMYLTQWQQSVNIMPHIN